jgi:glycosyltransferase involved in cell wall biosynthesis
MDVSVVMATYRRPQLLRKGLEALLKQTLAPSRYEIIVVDDGRSEDTRAVVTELAARTAGRGPALRYLHPAGPTRGPAGARNTGWRAAQAPLIAFTDDDTLPEPTWLAEGLKAMAADHGMPVVAAAGQVVVPISGRPTDHARMTQGLERAEFATANAFARRDALLQVGGFDERFTRAWREDSDLHFSLLALGAVVLAPEARVVHPVREVRWGVSLGQQANVQFDALLYKKHRRLFRQRIRPRPPWLYVGIGAATVAAVAALAAGQVQAAAAAAAAALAGIGLFAARRLRGASLHPSHVAEMLVTSAAIPYLALFWRLVGSWRYRVAYL